MNEPHTVLNEVVLWCQWCHKDEDTTRISLLVEAPSTRTQAPITLFSGAVQVWDCNKCGHLLMTYIDVRFSLYDSNISRLVEIPEMDRLGELGQEILKTLDRTVYYSRINDTKVYVPPSLDTTP